MTAASFLDAQMAEAHANLANALQQLGNFDMAIIYYQVISLCFWRAVLLLVSISPPYVVRDVLTYRHVVPICPYAWAGEHVGIVPKLCAHKKLQRVACYRALQPLHS